MHDSLRGAAYLASHAYLNHKCVVRVITPREPTSQVQLERLRDRVRMAYRVHHPSVVRLLECDTLGETLFVVREFVDGVDLEYVLARGQRLPWPQVAEVAADAVRGLAAIHRAGLVHGELRPSNFLLDRGGRVRLTGLESSLLEAELIGEASNDGSPLRAAWDYHPPEQLAPGAARRREGDFFALGAVLFAALTGAAPHDDGAVFRRIVNLHFRAPAWPPAVAAVAAPSLLRVIERLLDPDPDRRLVDEDELLASLPVDPACTSRSMSVRLDDLRPNGVAVAPFEFRAESGGGEWLGDAIAGALARRLSPIAGVFVVEPELFSESLRRAVNAERGADADARWTAARAVGAASIVCGVVERDDERLTLRLDVQRPDPRCRSVRRVVEGTVSALWRLECEAARHVADILRLAAPSAPLRDRAAADPLAARERLVRARRAFTRGDYAAAAAEADAAAALDADSAEALGLGGAGYARLGRCEEAEARHRRVEALALRTQDDRMLVEALTNLGVLRYFTGRFDEAAEFYTRAADLAEAHGLAVELAHICNNLGFVQIRRRQFEEAERAFRRAIDTYRSYGALAALVGPYNGMGNVLLEQRRFNEARTYYRRALAIAIEIGDRTSVGTTHMHLGRCGALEGRTSDAQAEFAVALATLEETRFWNGLARTYEFVYELNIAVGDLESALRCLDRRLELARAQGGGQLEAVILKQRAELLERLDQRAPAARDAGGHAA